MPTTQNVHGHEILRLVHTAPTAFTRATLAQEAARRYGPDARFCTCSVQDMTLSQLVDFLVSRGKLIEAGGQLRADISQMCQDGEGH